MQILEPPSTTTYQTEQGHFIKTFLISTKPNQAGWQISKETGHQKVQSFIGKPFVIIPENLSSQTQKGHVFASTKEDLLEEYKKHTHGIIESISSPYYYGDGTDDYYYTANIKLSNSKAASALLEHGEKTFGTFAVSPHIWTFDGSDSTADWEGISLSLVPKGAYGQEAVVNKYCKGDVVACSNSLAASVQSLAAAKSFSGLSDQQIHDMKIFMRIDTEHMAKTEAWAQMTGHHDRGGMINVRTGEEVQVPFNRNPDVMVKTYTTPAMKDLQPENVGKLGTQEEFDSWEKAYDLRQQQVKDLAFETHQGVVEDIGSGELYLNSNNDLVNAKYGGMSTSEALAEGKISVNGSLATTNFVSANITPSGGGSGECCIFNPAGGGGCGPCR